MNPVCLQVSLRWGFAESLAGCSCASWEMMMMMMIIVIITDWKFPPGSTSWACGPLNPQAWPGWSARCFCHFSCLSGALCLRAGGQAVLLLWLGSGFHPARGFAPCAVLCFGAGVVQGWVIKLLQLHNSLLIVLVNTTWFCRMGTGRFGLVTRYSRHSEH